MSHDFSPTTNLEGEKIVRELFEGRGLGEEERRVCYGREHEQSTYIHVWKSHNESQCGVCSF